MKNLNRDAASRSIDYKEAMERHNKAPGDFKYPGMIIGAAVLVFGGIALFIGAAWNSL